MFLPAIESEHNAHASRDDSDSRGVDRSPPSQVRSVYWVWRADAAREKECSCEGAREQAPGHCIGCCNFNRCSVARGGGMPAVTTPQSLPPAASEHAVEIATSPVTSIVAAPVPSTSGQRMVRAGRLRLRPRRRVLLCVLGKVEVETVVASREALRKNVSKCKRLATGASGCSQLGSSGGDPRNSLSCAGCVSLPTSGGRINAASDLW